MFFVGIDEAGYGPILGPLVIGGVMLRCPCEPPQEYLWRELGEVIADRPRKKEARLVVCDSKMLSTRPDGLTLLERAGLVAARLAGVETGTWRALVTGLDPQVGEHLGRCPWEAEGDVALPHACKADSLSLQTSVVRHAMQRAGCSLEAIAATVLPPVRYNELVQRTGNKATVLWSATTWTLNRLLQVAAARGPGEPVVAILDRQGGRTDYRAALQRSFEPMELAELQRSPECSRYRMVLPVAAGSAVSGNSHGPATAQDHATQPSNIDPPGSDSMAAHDAAMAPGQAVDLTLKMDADLQCCVTAWGSIVAKYTREICMVRLNDWWRARVENLEPTAGYLPDGRRFAEQCRPHFVRLGISPEIMIRER